MVTTHVNEGYGEPSRTRVRFSAPPPKAFGESRGALAFCYRLQEGAARPPCPSGACVTWKVALEDIPGSTCDSDEAAGKVVQNERASI